MITMRLNKQRMTVILKLLERGDIDSLSIQSSILTRLLQLRDVVERVVFILI